MLKVEGLNVSYGDLQVLWDVSFNVKEGEIVVLLGANGAGKSTVLKTISSLVKPKTGSVQFLEFRLDKISSYQVINYGLAHVPEGRRLFPEMTVEENLIIGSLTSEAKAKRKQTLEWLYEIFPRLRERIKQPTGTLSGGEQQMVAIARGLMSLPKLIMFDEPSLGLAPIMVTEIFKVVEMINREGVTVLLVEQNVHHTLAMCDRAYVLENGRITLSGTGEEFLNNDHIKEAYLGI
ncbi:MAG: ABC transporter ATP-binding protein [Desulfomonilaceae bacterium]